MSERRFGQWAGNLRGSAEDVTKCIEEVYPAGRSIIPAQCQRKRGHGPNGLFCKQHGIMVQGKLTKRGADWFNAEYDLPADEEVSIVELPA